MAANSAEACLDAGESEVHEGTAEFFATGVFETGDRSSAGYMPTDQAENVIRTCYSLWKMGQKKSEEAPTPD
jgi:hypothetical protein